MKTEAHAVPIKQKYFTPGVYVLLAIAMLGFLAGLNRFVFGLGAATNLNNQYPWGMWIAVDVATGVALAAGGFTTAALAHIFHRHNFEAIVRPGLLSALLGYTFVVIGLMADLGRYYNIWHPMLPSMWQGNSVLFEVAMCVMAYLTVLYLEFMPVVCERFIGQINLPGALRMLNKPLDLFLRTMNFSVRKIMFLLIIAGVVLSFMHQSSLGSLMLIAPYKVHPLWYTPLLPLLFLMSAIAVGYPMVIFEGTLSTFAFKRKSENHLLAPLSRFVIVLAGLYLIVKITDLLFRGAYVHLFEGGLAPTMFIIEIGLMAVPVVLLTSRRVRASDLLLFGCALMIILSVVVNRINVFLIAYQPPYAETRYVPAVQEVLLTLGLVATLMLVYRFVVIVFPVLPAEEHSVRPPEARAGA